MTAGISLLLVVLSYDEVWSSLLYLRRVWTRTRNYRVVWDTFWWRASVEAEQVAVRV